MLPFPTNFSEYLLWFKHETETYWSVRENCYDLQREQEIIGLWGAKWLGLEDTKIDAIEKKYNINFNPQHREFLKVLHTIDSKLFAIDEEGDTRPVTFFHDWEDDEAIFYRLNAPYKWILEDVLKKTFWLDSWGEKPEEKENRIQIFEKWYNAAPKLIPILGHRYVVNAPLFDSFPIVSSLGTDTIVYAWDMLHYLKMDIAFTHPSFLKKEKVYDEYLKQYINVLTDEMENFYNYNGAQFQYKMISYWGELIAKNCPNSFEYL